MMVAMTADPTVERLTAAIHQLTAMLEVAGRTPPLDRCTEEEQRAK
jgi:hypothetical protein